MVGRRIVAVIAGVVVAIVLVQVAEFAVHALYPPPPGYDMRDMAAVKKFVAALPTTALFIVLCGWLIATLSGTFLAARIGKSAIPGYIVGAFLLIGGIVNAFIIPQPVWFSAASFVIYVGMTIAGSRLAAPPIPVN